MTLWMTERLGDCAICGSDVYDTDAAEMYDPHADDEDSHLVHPECGLQKGWLIA